MPATSTEHRYALEVADRPDVLLRIVGVCLRRGCEVRELRYTHGSPGTVEIVLAVGARHAGALRGVAERPGRRARRA
jgi:acetolactate synthase regulatory subunit